MTLKVIRSGEFSTTRFARVRFDSSVDPVVHFEVAQVTERLVTHLTRVWLFGGVTSVVNSEGRRIRERFATNLTRVRFHTRVYSVVTLKMARRVETFPTLATHVTFENRLYTLSGHWCISRLTSCDARRRLPFRLRPKVNFQLLFCKRSFVNC